MEEMEEGMGGMIEEGLSVGKMGRVEKIQWSAKHINPVKKEQVNCKFLPCELDIPK